ncbi:MAG: VOC family protein [Planctomycetaceae bacterium]|nr:VOC family protein [Planctomycetaceae bacterium]
MAFYRKVLGAELLQGDDPITCPWLQLGGLTITLLENTDRSSQLSFSEQAMATLLVFTDDISGAFDRATRWGARVIEPLVEGNANFLIADPDGIYIEVAGE